MQWVYWVYTNLQCKQTLKNEKSTLPLGLSISNNIQWNNELTNTDLTLAPDNSCPPKVLPFLSLHKVHIKHNGTRFTTSKGTWFPSVSSQQASKHTHGFSHHFYLVSNMLSSVQSWTHWKYSKSNRAGRQWIPILQLPNIDRVLMHYFTPNIQIITNPSMFVSWNLERIIN